MKHDNKEISVIKEITFRIQHKEHSMAEKYGHVMIIDLLYDGKVVESFTKSMALTSFLSQLRQNFIPSPVHLAYPISVPFCLFFHVTL